MKVQYLEAGNLFHSWSDFKELMRLSRMVLYHFSTYGFSLLIKA